MLAPRLLMPGALTGALIGVFLGPQISALFVAPAQPVQEKRAAATLVAFETAPTETDLGHGDLAETAEVWGRLLGEARESIDLAFFYASPKASADTPEPSAAEGESEDSPCRLEPMIRALEDAAERDVQVRFLLGAELLGAYPEVRARLDAQEGIEVRVLDLAEHTGGVLHAKYILVDERRGVVGSQNFDWRALEHIQELGVLFDSAHLAMAFGRVFAFDWALAGGEEPPSLGPSPTSWSVPTVDGGRVTPVFSPRDLLPDPELWDLPRILAAIDAADRMVSLQFLTYRAVARDGTPWDELEGALRRAAERGVAVRLLLSHWATSAGTIDGLKELHQVPGIEVRILTVPEHSRGFVPFSRVAHAKYLVADAAVAWVGTSNASSDYFYASRNAGLLVEGSTLPERLEAYFSHGWGWSGTEAIDPEREYPAPRVGE